MMGSAGVRGDGGCESERGERREWKGETIAEEKHRLIVRRLATDSWLMAND